MLPTPDPLCITPDSPQLDRLIQAERVRMLYGAALPVDLVSSVFSVALATLIGAQVGWLKTGIWAGACLLVSAIRWLLCRAYRRASDRSDDRWLHHMMVMSGLLGSAWGLGCAWMLPAMDLNISSVIVGALIGSATVATFALQAHPRPNTVFNSLALIPCALLLFTRLDTYGLFGGAGLLTMLGVVLMEGHRSTRRITELLWLRFTTDRIAQERAQALKLAQRTSAVKDQFLATMSHEMRTPLHGILGLARLVRQKLPDRPGVLAESREQLALIERSGEHLLGIINDVLDFSRIEAGKLHIDPDALDLHALIDDVLSLLAVTAAQKGLPLNRHINIPSPCWVVGDASRLRQMLHNLIGNAIKFTSLGHVTVHVERAPAPNQHSPGLQQVVFTIQDTGIGIAPDQQALVFDAFHQADGSFVRRHQGTGLGLTISREIARAMNGDIVCHSTPGQGSTFTLNVPLAATTAPASVTFAASRPAPLLPESGSTVFAGHVLLAEDNPVNAMVAEATLNKLGLHVTHVEDGQQALDALQAPHHGFDLVLMDCQMPVLDGIEATRRLRCQEQEQGRPKLPVIALTANVMGSDRERCRSAGMDDHLAKPFSAEELATMLTRHLHAPTPLTA
ncbi:MAG: ATP-binding protein [Pseudomonadota bacterium]